MASKATVQSVEPNVADLVNGWLKSYKVDYKLEQESLNTEIDQALNDYFSKNGGKGGNRPDAKLLLLANDGKYYPILIEYKGYKDKLVKLDAEGNVANRNAKNQPDFATINSDAVTGAGHYAFIAELEAQRVAELSAYLTVSGYDNYELSDAELCALQAFKTVNWKSFNLEELFGKATRGKRLKSADRVVGNLPFVTAGEAFEGVSAHIGNEVEVFDANTTTIDMFGSAKYRSYKYGADDHIAVVHTDKLPIKASIFVTSAIHKASHTGKFDYGNNFYAKDADVLDIMLPEKNGKPDYAYMEILISAIHKQVIKEVVLYSDRKIAATKEVVSKTE